MRPPDAPATVLRRCRSAYGDVPGFLDHHNPFELLISVILSAQTTDEQVNRVTPLLFSLFPDPASLAAANQLKVEELIRSTGYYHAKAKNIIAAARFVQDSFKGRVPDTMEDLVRIPGVGRKSAGVVLFHVFGKPAIIVDTHFGRVARRLGFSQQEDPTRLENDVAKLFPPEDWGATSMLLNLHGRRICTARKPRCADCFLLDLCPAAIITV